MNHAREFFDADFVMAAWNRQGPVMAETASSEPFRALASALKEGGFTAHGDRLENILGGTWTTSSELVSELGQAVVTIRRECKPLNPSQKALLGECLRQVRIVWPGFGWSSWPGSGPSLMRTLTGWLLIAGGLLAGFVSLLAAVAGILSLQKVLTGPGFPYAAGYLIGYLLVVVVMFVLSQRLMKAGRARLVNSA